MTDTWKTTALTALADRIELWPIEKLRPYERNPRTHSDAQVDQIAASMIEFGWTNPVLVDEEGGVLAGDGRLLAARRLGLAEVPVIRFEHLSEAQKRAYMIADNQLTLNSGWDDALLAEELELLLERAGDGAAYGMMLPAGGLGDLLDRGAFGALEQLDHLGLLGAGARRAGRGGLLGLAVGRRGRRVGLGRFGRVSTSRARSVVASVPLVYSISTTSVGSSRICRGGRDSSRLWRSTQAEARVWAAMSLAC